MKPLIKRFNEFLAEDNSASHNAFRGLMAHRKSGERLSVDSPEYQAYNNLSDAERERFLALGKRTQDYRMKHEHDDHDKITVQVDMGWDESDHDENAAAHAAFAKYHLMVEPIDSNPGTFEVTGKKEDILAYLKSEFYEMDDDAIAEYYPELL
jgi:hypothetical protein